MGGPSSSNSHSTAAVGGPHLPTLEAQYYSYLAQGLAASTCKSYATAQSQFLSVCRQLGRIHSSVSPCPADEWTLCLFTTFLAGSLQHSSIKVYLSGMRALHIEQGFADPLHNCQSWQRVICGIKRTQGSPSSSRLPIIYDLMLVIWKSLNLQLPNHCMFWAACTLGYFGFLRSAEFTVPSLASFSPSAHLDVQDIVVDSSTAPLCIRVTIKASKTDPFHKGCSIHIGFGKYPLCAVHAWLAYLAIRGDGPGPLFLCQNGQPLSRTLLSNWLRQIMASAGTSGNFSSHNFQIGAATSAGGSGIPDHLIQELGRWKSNSFQSYIRTPSAALASLSQKLA